MRRRFKVLIPPLVCLSLTGCVLPYYLQAVHGQVSLLHQREPIEEVIGDSSFDAETRERLELVLELRQFAVRELDLPDNGSYTSYVDLGRDYVVWNVVAAPEFSIEPVTWCFPFAGCVAYRGYFDADRAEAFAEKLRAKGYDTFSGGSPAYSTLGHFADPVLNTMLSGDEAAIAATLFHELAHQRVYVKDDTELSESFATAVEQYGVEEWLTREARPVVLERYRAQLDRQVAFADLVARQRERLAALFAEDLDPDAKRAAKAEAYARMRRDYEALKAGWGGRGDYDGWFVGGFNNARLVAVTSYQRWVPGLRWQLKTLGPEAFYTAIEALTRLKPAARIARLSAWNDASAVAALSNGGELVDAAAQIAVNDRLHMLRRDAESREAVVATDHRDGQ
jgi:predicted aminopeptidase